ncbi:SH3 domain-containing protein [bacterium]|nr:SH3 domain-containing protein [bacterium]
MKKRIILAVFVVLAVSTLFARTGVITWDHINLREGPGTRFKRLRNFEEGKYFEILGQKGNWIEVNANGMRGYLYKDGIKEVKTLGKYKVMMGGVLFMWGPSEKYDTLAIRESGIEVEVVWAQGNYLFGQFNGSGVWFDSMQVIEVVKPVEEESDIETATIEDIPEPPEFEPIPEPVVQAKEEAVVEPIEVKINLEDETKKESRWFFGVALTGREFWIYSKAVDSSKDIDLITIEIGKDYRQTMLGIDGRFQLEYSLTKKDNLRALFAPGFGWTPKDYSINVDGNEFKLHETYLQGRAQLGLAYKIMPELTLAAGGGATIVGHKMEFAHPDSEKDEILHDEWYIVPTGFIEARYGSRIVKTVLGFGYTHWVSQNTRFFVIDDGTTVPVGDEINRNSYEVFFGVLLSK